MKKNAPIDPNAPINYRDFASRMFDPPKPKTKPGKGGKGGKKK
jgi:hypothetical protein